MRHDTTHIIAETEAGGRSSHHSMPDTVRAGYLPDTTTLPIAATQLNGANPAQTCNVSHPRYILEDFVSALILFPQDQVLDILRTKDRNHLGAHL